MSSKKGKVDPLKFVSSPGPSVYTPNYNKMFKSFSYSMTSRPNSAKASFTPGPGNYNLRTDRSTIVPCYKYFFI